MPPRPSTVDLHAHSSRSDGVLRPERLIEEVAAVGVTVFSLTDHDTLAAKRQGEERWYDDVLVLVGEEVSPIDRDHFLAFGIDEEINRRAKLPVVA